MYRECWNKFLFFFFLFCFTGVKYRDLATITCNLYLFILYYIIYMALGLASLYFTWAEILGGNLSLCLVWHFLLFPLSSA